MNHEVINPYLKTEWSHCIIKDLRHVGCDKWVSVGLESWRHCALASMLSAATSWCKLDTCVSSLSTDDLVLCTSKFSPSKESPLETLGAAIERCLSILSRNSLWDSRGCPSVLKTSVLMIFQNKHFSFLHSQNSCIMSTQYYFKQRI